MAASLYWKAEGRKALRYNVNILNLWPLAAQWSCHNERRAPFWLYLPVILTLPPSMQAAEAFGLADTEAACTRDGHMKMPTSLQAPHSETHNSPALVCFFQQLPGKWPSASFILALHLQLTALGPCAWDKAALHHLPVPAGPNPGQWHGGHSSARLLELTNIFSSCHLMVVNFSN